MASYEIRQDVLAECLLAESLRQKHIDALLSEGIPPLWLTRTASDLASMVCRDRVVFIGECGFEFVRHVSDGVGEEAFVCPVFDSEGEPVDILAWKPPRFALWLGRVAVLGEENVLRPRLAGQPLLVHSTITDWFRQGRRGIFIVDYRLGAHLLANEILGVFDAEHSRRLRTKLIIPSPPVVVIQDAEQAA